MHLQFILADLKKAFYQVQLSAEDCDLLVFRWPNIGENGEVSYEYYSFERLAMGIKCAPAALNCCLRKLFRQHAASHPIDADFMKILERTAYVDDIPVAGNNQQETCSRMALARDIAAEGRFIFEKYVSYPPTLAEEFGVPAATAPFKVLGVRFDPADDQLSISMKNIDEFWGQEQITKRQAASLMARAYDLLGLASPAFLPIKKLRQDLDRFHPKAGWNAALSAAETLRWHEATREIQHLLALHVNHTVMVQGRS
jgi:hypothetical protein